MTLFGKLHTRNVCTRVNQKGVGVRYSIMKGPVVVFKGL